MLATRVSARASTARAIRSYSAAATASSSSTPASNLASQYSESTSPSGVRVASFEDHSPVTTLSVVLPAGSRYEPLESPGAAHFLKAFAFKNTTKRTGFRLTREAELQGAVLSAELGREFLCYTARFLRDDLPYFVESLSDSVLQPKFAHHELAAVQNQVASETSHALASSESLLTDILHRAAYRSGLGHSLYAHQPLTIEQIKAYLATRSSAGISVVANGADHASLSSLVQEAFAEASPSSSPSSSPSTFHGGEERAVLPGASHFAIAWDVQHSRTTATILEKLLGSSGPRVRWGEGVSPLASLSSRLADTSVTALQLSYTDASLFSLAVAGPRASEAAKAAIAELRKVADGSISSEALSRAIKIAKMDLVSARESSLDRALSIASDAGLGIKRTPLVEASSALDSVSAQQVQDLAKSLLKSKPATAAVGNPNALPYANDLGL
ncbi:MAG: Metalloenzyme, LuxS/M16 peptidase-like protein [Piptocephalis tieghemiana]|nr:MAG: Metalloenzyme, LuxS/M16 peptidase-like protein [Piptocephalis tieghemiana]